MFVNYAKPRVWWSGIDQPHSRMTVGNTIAIRGWAFNPFAEIVSVEAFIGGKRYGTLKYGEVRPDIYRLFRLKRSKYCGFSGRIRFETTINRDLTIVIRLVDDVEDVTEITVDITVSAPVKDVATQSAISHLPEPHVVDEIRRIIDLYHLRFLHDPVIADWDTGFNLQTIFPDLQILQVLDSTFPYLENSLDVVIVGTQHIRHLESAQRAAKNLLVGVIGGANGRIEFKAQWLNPSEMTDTITVIITTDEKTDLAALQDILATMQSEFIAEIIIIHDVKLAIDPLVRKDPRIKEVFSSSEISLVVTQNRAGLSALGDILIFLNGNEIPQPGWLAPIMHTISSMPECGAILGKTLGIDGRLYEAGAHVFRDGTLYSFGQTDVDIHATQYTYPREIDAGTAGLFATRRTLFASLRGFNTAYSANGYEVIDYCFRIRDDEKRVMYQPRAVVRQIFTPRRDDRDRTLFVESWKEQLENHPERPSEFDMRTLHKLLSGSTDRKQVLICLDTLSKCRDSAQYKRIQQMVRFIRSQPYEVCILLTGQPENALLIPNTVYGNVPIYLLTGRESQFEIAEFLQAYDFDYVIYFDWKTSESIMPIVRENLPEARNMLDVLEVDFIRVQRKNSGRLNPDHGNALVAEMNVFRDVDGLVVADESQCRFLFDFNLRQPNLSYIPLVDHLPVSKLGFGQRRGILMIGDFRNQSDKDALAFFESRVVSQIDAMTLAANPIYVIGCGLESLAVTKSPHIRYLGRVPAIFPYIERASVVIVPAQERKAMQIAIIQAMLVGTPVVCTSHAVDGFRLVHEENVLIADEPGAFAACILRLLDDDDLWIRIAAFGYEYMLEARDEKVFGEGYQEYFV